MMNKAMSVFDLPSLQRIVADKGVRGLDLHNRTETPGHRKSCTYRKLRLCAEFRGQ